MVKRDFARFGVDLNLELISWIATDPSKSLKFVCYDIYVGLNYKLTRKYISESWMQFRDIKFRL